jgi:hypothetical protein
MFAVCAAWRARSGASGVAEVELASLGTLWGAALVFWGLCAVVIAVVALLRSAPADDAAELGRLRARIRRYQLASAARSPAPPPPRPQPQPAAAVSRPLVLDPGVPQS